MKIAPRIPPWNRCDDGSSGSKLGWGHIPSGVKELILASEDDKLLDLNKIFTEFYPRCFDILQTHGLGIQKTYDWNIPLSIRAAYVIAGDLYLEGQTLQSARMVFFAALMHECMSSKNEVLDMVVDIKLFAHIQRAVVNTETANLLLDFIREMHPNRGWAQTLKQMSNKQQSTFDQPLHVSNASIPDQPMLKLITLFLQAEADQYREFQIYEDVTLQHLFAVCYLFSMEFDDKDDEKDCVRAVIRYGYITNCLFNNKRVMNKIMCGVLAVVSVNERVLYLTTSGKKTLKQLGINEGDICSYDYVPKESNSGESKSSSANNTVFNNKTNNKKKSSRRTKAKGSSATATLANQEPTKQQLKEDHSRSFEPVINELIPLLQPIRRNLDSLTLERSRPKQEKVSKVASNDKENTCNFFRTSESTAKAGKAVFPIVVGQVSNLYNSSKSSHRRKSKQLKTISLDLHGMSKADALQKLRKSLPNWNDLAMKGEYPWVIPVDIICGCGNQILSEVVTDWIKKENKVGNRPKNYHRI